MLFKYRTDPGPPTPPPPPTLSWGRGSARGTRSRPGLGPVELLGSPAEGSPFGPWVLWAGGMRGWSLPHLRQVPRFSPAGLQFPSSAPPKSSPEIHEGSRGNLEDSGLQGPSGSLTHPPVTYLKGTSPDGESPAKGKSGVCLMGGCDAGGAPASGYQLGYRVVSSWRVLSQLSLPCVSPPNPWK